MITFFIDKFRNGFVDRGLFFLIYKNQASLNQKKGELENRRQDIVGGLLLRSRANWHEVAGNGKKVLEKFHLIYANIENTNIN
jgi:hypothetical protein